MGSNFTGFDRKKALDRIGSLIETVTCLECCCMYVVPTGTAECGHCLCKTCWLGRTHCPECNVKIDKSKLKFNETLAEMQKLVDGITQNFESVFEIDVSEALILEDDKKTTEKPTNRVEDWLKNSQNKFSAMLSQDPTQDQNQIESGVKVLSKAQVHESKKEKIEPVKKKITPNPPQEDWDKIEIVPDTDNDIRENILGPMDLEPFEIDDEYTAIKPRRSLRKRQNSISDNSKQNNNDNRNSPAECSTDTEKKADKSKQSWKEVKKMRREFGKLAKSKPKLNVSIEKIKRSNSKQTTIAQFSVSKESQEPIDIDDNTPNIVENINNKRDGVESNMEEIDCGSKENYLQTKNSKLKEKSVSENENDLLNKSDTTPVLFVKKSVLSQNKLEINNSQKARHIDSNISKTVNVTNPRVTSNIQNNSDDNSVTNSISFNDNSIHITIKFRGTETYINIKPDDTCNDQGVQTNPVTVSHKNIGVTTTTRPVKTQTAPESSSQKKKSNFTTITQKNMCSVGVQTNDVQFKCSNDGIQSHDSKDKSSKKNTDSADTATANYEITETIAKELSIIMECDENDKPADTKIERSNTRSSQKPKSQHKEPDTLQGMDDIDIFHSGSVKEKPVHKLQDAMDTQSEILATNKTTRSRIRSTADKRQRDTCDEDKSRTKRQKKTQDIQNTSGTNYDELLGQILTNIDDEIQKSNEKVDKLNDQKYSENIFSLAEKESQAMKDKTQVPPEMSQEDIDNLLTPGMCEDLAQDAQLQPSSDKAQPVDVVCTPIIPDDEDDHSVVEDTPQKSISFAKPKSRDSKSSGGVRKRPQLDQGDSDSVAIVSLDSRKDSRQTMDSPMTITRFVDQIQHNSTPVARKALDFLKNSDTDDDNVTICPSLNVAKTTQEKALMTEAFEIESQVRKPLSPINVSKQYCMAGSCLKPNEMTQLKLFSQKKKWILADKYSAAVTHLIVGVDEHNISQRSVKYMCALAAGCWILSPQWVNKCLETNTIVKEEPYEVLDSNGEPGPRRSRLAKTKIFSGISFYCLPPFKVLDSDTLKGILEVSGGKVVNEIKALKDSLTPAFLLAEPEHTEDLRYMSGKVDLATLKAIYRGGVKLALDEPSRSRIQQASATVDAIVSSGKVTYGINTGFGKLAQTTIPNERLAELQRNLVLSHSLGLGELLPDDVVRVIMATKVISLSRGHSGIRIELVDGLISLFNAGVMPCIPEKGSVGASGDLAPLAHLSLMLLGEGEVRVAGKLMPAAQGLALAGLQPFVLGPKEGLALLNGTQVSTALALRGLFEAENAFAAGLVAGSLSLEAIKGSLKPFDHRIHEARGQQGQIDVAAAVSALLEGSDILPSHANCGRVQDPYSIRCVPQVMGACLDNLNHAAKVLQIEANAASDNPLVFTDTGEVISSGNFHAEPVAFAADIIALAVAEIGAISERRLALLLDTGLSGLPPFLVNDAGVNSGFMIAQVTAAALASENKSLAHPGSVDSLPTSANQEDHVSMATYAARRLGAMCFNTAAVVSIEAMAAAQGIDFHRPLRSSPQLEQVLASIRQRVPYLEKDRQMSPDIEQMRQWASQDTWPEMIAALLPARAR